VVRPSLDLVGGLPISGIPGLLPLESDRSDVIRFMWRLRWIFAACEAAVCSASGVEFCGLFPGLRWFPRPIPVFVSASCASGNLRRGASAPLRLRMCTGGGTRVTTGRVWSTVCPAHTLARGGACKCVRSHMKRAMVHAGGHKRGLYLAF